MAQPDEDVEAAAAVGVVQPPLAAEQDDGADGKSHSIE